MWVECFNNYEVSDDGRIRNNRTKRELKQFVGRDGYARAQFAGKTRLIHRVVAEAFLEEVSGKEFVNHIDGNKQNNCVSNLEWCTFGENLVHAYRCGLKSVAKENNPRCKLTSDDVDYIKQNYKRGDVNYGAKALARKFGVAHQTICAVVWGQNWK